MFNVRFAYDTVGFKTIFRGHEDFGQVKMMGQDTGESPSQADSNLGPDSRMA